MTCDVFISYCKEEIEITKQLANILDDKGFSVWWDNGLLSGDDFTEVIQERLHECKAAIVIWTSASVKRRFVRAEAKIADELGKLLPVRVKELMLRDIPPPYNLLHTELFDNIDAIVASLARLQIKPKAKLVIGKTVLIGKTVFPRPFSDIDWAPPVVTATSFVPTRIMEDEQSKKSEAEKWENLRAGGTRRELVFKEIEVNHGPNLADPVFSTGLYEMFLREIQKSGSLEATEEFHKRFYLKLPQLVREKDGKRLEELFAGLIELLRLKEKADKERI